MIVQPQSGKPSDGSSAEESYQIREAQLFQSIFVMKLVCFWVAVVQVALFRRGERQREWL